MKPLDVVSVVELGAGGNSIKVASYPNTPTGNKAAEKLFMKLARDHKVKKVVLEFAKDWAWTIAAADYPNGSESWSLAIVPSTVATFIDHEAKRA